MGAQDGLHLGGIDVHAAADHHVLAAVEQHHESVFVEASDVAGADEAVALRVVPLGLGGLGRLLVVAGHHRARSADHLAGFALGTLLLEALSRVPLSINGQPLELPLDRGPLQYAIAGAASLASALVA